MCFGNGSGWIMDGWKDGWWWMRAQICYEKMFIPSTVNVSTWPHPDLKQAYSCCSFVLVMFSQVHEQCFVGRAWSDTTDTAEMGCITDRRQASFLCLATFPMAEQRTGKLRWLELPKGPPEWAQREAGSCCQSQKWGPQEDVQSVGVQY